MVKILYLKDFNHMKNIQNKLTKLGYNRNDQSSGFYSGSVYHKNGKVITFGSIGIRYTMAY